jgi:hypothetical protein
LRLDDKTLEKAMHDSLLNKNVIIDYLMQDSPWSGSHGADQDYLGMGLLYYSIVYALKAEVAVCLGSGGGFVPRLMRQAQRDLGTASTARTILVDGNNPAAGWGAPTWLSNDSFFRRHFPDVEIVIDLTNSAAKNFFEQQDIAIDYLHVDADHSFEGCLEDFQTYRRFLREGSVITFHDTNFHNAGVNHVLEYVRTRCDCEVIDFRDVGVGTALVRIGKDQVDSGFELQSSGTFDSDQAIRVTRHADARPLAPSWKDWTYLESVAFSTRYILAAHFIAPCRSVIEIGGAKTPIDQFLTGGHDSVLVLDPFIREGHRDMLRGKPCQVSYVRARFQDVDWHISTGAHYGLVMLGLEIQGMEAHHYEALFQLVNNARVTVLEFPTSWEPSREQFKLITNNTSTKEVFQVKLDLDGNDFGDLSNSWPPRCDREIHVLTPR